MRDARPPSPADRLSTYWDTRGNEAEHTAAAGLDPESIDTIAALYARDDAHFPDPAFLNQLETTLMNAHTISPVLPPLDPPRLLIASRQTTAPDFGWLPANTREHQRRGWLASVATAALVILMVIGSFLLFGPIRPGRQSPVPVLAPASMATPATPAGDGMTTELLLNLVIPTISSSEVWVELDRYTFPAATALDVASGGGAPKVFFVEDGTLEVSAREGGKPVRVIRAGATNAEEMLGRGGSATLSAGDAIVVPEDGRAALMNVTEAPAAALLLLVPRSLDLPYSNEIEYEALGGTYREVNAPLTLTLERATLLSDAELPGLEAPDGERVVGLVDPDRVMDARKGANSALKNAGDEPLAAYVLTVISSTPGGTPTAGSS